MDYKDQLTNEKISKRFTSQFELVNYAIKLAENMIITGRDPRVRIDTQNRSLQVVSEIYCNKDWIDQIAVVEKHSQIEQQSAKEEPHRTSEKGSGRKKSKKVFAD